MAEKTPALVGISPLSRRTALNGSVSQGVERDDVGPMDADPDVRGVSSQCRVKVGIKDGFNATAGCCPDLPRLLAGRECAGGFMLRIGPAIVLAAVAALGLSACATSYSYRNEPGNGDYYYAEPSVDYHFVYGAPYGSLGYGYPGGWYGSFGYRFGFGLPYSRYGFPYFGNPYPYYGYPYFGYRHDGHRHHRPYPPGLPPPGVISPRPPGPGTGPRIGDGDPDGGPWRHLGRVRPRIKTPQPGIDMGRQQWEAPPGPAPLQRPRIEGPRQPVATPQPSIEFRPRIEPFRTPPAAGRPMERQEREIRREPTP